MLHIFTWKTYEILFGNDPENNMLITEAGTIAWLSLTNADGCHPWSEHVGIDLRDVLWKAFHFIVVYAHVKW